VSLSEMECVKATVTGISKAGYKTIAFADSIEYGIVTFDTSVKVWSRDTLPQTGEIVILSEMARFTKGWRAKTARPFVLADEG
jgi:hypothetical protein